MKTYYGKEVSKSYFIGCSTGGRQALKQAQKYPDDFDGVVAGALAWWETRLLPWMVYYGSLNLPSTYPEHIPSHLFDVILEEMIKQCDVQDGVKDGIAMSPETCKFSPDTLLCNEGGTSGCLTRPQLQTLRNLLADWKTKEGDVFFPSLELVTGLDMAAVNQIPIRLGLTYMENFVFKKPNWDWTTISQSVAEYSDSLNPGEVNAD